VRPHGIETYRVDGNDVFDVNKAVTQAVRNARAGQPSFIEAITYRYKEHWGGGDDWDLGYRSREEVEKWREKDPLAKIRSQLSKISPKDIDLIEIKVKMEIQDALTFATQSPPPSKNSLLL
jgi:TPP-dependent pyruvate/acetoin dehydrogenase alpha subunit